MAVLNTRVDPNHGEYNTLQVDSGQVFLGSETWMDPSQRSRNLGIECHLL